MGRGDVRPRLGPAGLLVGGDPRPTGAARRRARARRRLRLRPRHGAAPATPAAGARHRAGRRRRHGPRDPRALRLRSARRGRPPEPQRDGASLWRRRRSFLGRDVPLGPRSRRAVRAHRPGDEAGRAHQRAVRRRGQHRARQGDRRPPVPGRAAAHLEVRRHGGDPRAPRAQRLHRRADVAAADAGHPAGATHLPRGRHPRPVRAAPARGRAHAVRAARCWTSSTTRRSSTTSA